MKKSEDLIIEWKVSIIIKTSIFGIGASSKQKGTLLEEQLISYTILKTIPFI